MISTRGVTKTDLSPHEITHGVVENVNHAMRIHFNYNAMAHAKVICIVCGAHAASVSVVIRWCAVVKQPADKIKPPG
jgi:hypothetical protein